MKHLYLMRHAKSSWKDSSLSDHDRPLNLRGKMDAEKMGEYLNLSNLIPDMIICSTAKRARSTVDIFLQECPMGGNIVYSRDLYHGGFEDYIEALTDLENSVNSVLIVAHNPGIEFAIEEFSHTIEVMPTSAIAIIKFDLLSWDIMDNEVTGELVSVFRPKEV